MYIEVKPVYGTRLWLRLDQQWLQWEDGLLTQVEAHVIVG